MPPQPVTVTPEQAQKDLEEATKFYSSVGHSADSSNSSSSATVQAASLIANQLSDILGHVLSGGMGVSLPGEDSDGKKYDAPDSHLGSVAWGNAATVDLTELKANVDLLLKTSGDKLKELDPTGYGRIKTLAGHINNIKNNNITIARNAVNGDSASYMEVLESSGYLSDALKIENALRATRFAAFGNRDASPQPRIAPTVGPQQIQNVRSASTSVPPQASVTKKTVSRSNGSMPPYRGTTGFIQISEKDRKSKDPVLQECIRGLDAI